MKGEDRWDSGEFSAVEMTADQPRTLVVKEGSHDVIAMRTRRSCVVRFEAGGRVSTGNSGPGQFFLIPAGLTGSLHCEGPQTTWFIYLARPLLESAARTEAASRELGFRSVGFQSDVLVQTTVSSLIAELKGEAPGRATILSALARVLAVQLIRRYGRLDGERRKPELSPYQLKLVLNHIEEHRTENITLAEMAELTRLSPHYFLRLFKQSTGLTPYHYILRRKIEYSKALMARDRVGLAEVALEVGFPSQSHFGTIFKKITGQTPRAWRNSAQPGEANAAGLEV